jgi:nucleotide-binding universal stress UspA family protein
VTSGTALPAKQAHLESGFTGPWLGFAHGLKSKSLESAVKEVAMINTHEVAESVQTLLPTSKETLFKNILLATDFSPASDDALEYAASLARRFASRIYLAHVITLDPIPMMAPEVAVRSLQELRVAAEKSMAEVLQSGRLNAVKNQVVIQDGNLWAVIEGWIQKYEIGLLVVGAHGAGAVRKIVIGSAAEEIFRKAQVPVLTVGPSAEKEPLYELEFKNILLATDFGRSAKREAEYAFSLAQEHRSTLRFLHVFSHPEAHSGDILVLEQKRYKTQLQELVPQTTELHGKLDFEVAVGEPVEQILRIAQETNADLIVMGAKARSSLAGNVPHTKAYRIVCGAHCPVLTVKS